MTTQVDLSKYAVPFEALDWRTNPEEFNSIGTGPFSPTEIYLGYDRLAYDISHAIGIARKSHLLLTPIVPTEYLRESVKAELGKAAALLPAPPFLALVPDPEDGGKPNVISVGSSEAFSALKTDVKKVGAGKDPRKFPYPPEIGRYLSELKSSGARQRNGKAENPTPNYFIQIGGPEEGRAPVVYVDGRSASYETLTGFYPDCSEFVPGGGALSRANGGFLFLDDVGGLLAKEGCIDLVQEAARTGNYFAGGVVVPSKFKLVVAEYLKLPEPHVPFAGSLDFYDAEREPLKVGNTPENRARIAKWACECARSVSPELSVSPEAIARVVDEFRRVAEARNYFYVAGSKVCSNAAIGAAVRAKSAGRTEVSGGDVRETLKYLSERGLAEQTLENENCSPVKTTGSAIGRANALYVSEALGVSYGGSSPIHVQVVSAKGPGKLEVSTELNSPTEDDSAFRKTNQDVETYIFSRYADCLANHVVRVSHVTDSSLAGPSSSALIAALCELTFVGIPVGQGIAVTGAIDPAGFVRGIGGENEKVTGWYEACLKDGGVCGKGVVVPKENIGTLMLDDGILGSVRRGEFTIYSVDKVEEISEILSKGIPYAEIRDAAKENLRRNGNGSPKKPAKSGTE